MLVMIVSFPAFTQTDTTRLVGVKAYKLGYLIRDAKALRACDSLAGRHEMEIGSLKGLNDNLRKQVASLNKENKKLMSSDSAGTVRYDAANELYLIDIEKERDRKKVWRKAAICEAILIVLGLVAILI